LYALLNRNFCIDLADIIPIFGSCYKQSINLENPHNNPNTRFPETILLQNEILAKKYENETEYYEQNQTTNDASCQVELLSRNSNN
jgi:hypothetical protein